MSLSKQWSVYGLWRAATARVRWQRAELRALPYPFRTYFTISSDCDASLQDVIGAAVCLSSVIRETYGLPICDSYFPKWLYECGLGGVPDEASRRAITGDFSTATLMTRCAEWLRGFHRGWFDTVHGWAYNMSVRLAPPVEIESDAGPVTIVSQFAAPPQWEEPAQPSYLTFDLIASTACPGLVVSLYEGDHCITQLDGATITRVAGRDGRIVIPLGAAVGDRPIECPAQLRLEVSVGESSTARVRIDRIALHTDRREDIAEQRVALSACNVRSSNFSSHAGGLVFAAPAGLRPWYGRRHLVRRLLKSGNGRAMLSWLTGGFRDPASLARRLRQFSAMIGRLRLVDEADLYSDLPLSLHYASDLLRDDGIEFMQTFACTHSTAQPRLDELLRTTRLGDGAYVYDYARYLSVADAGIAENDEQTPFVSNGTAVNPSWADAAGTQIQLALDRLAVRPQSGALLYTHLNFTSSTHPLARGVLGVETICDPAMHTALQRLAELHYNLSGTVVDAERVLVAPTGVLLRMAQVRRILKRAVRYDRDGNAIVINSRHDSVLGRRVPARDGGFRELRGVTFYVDDSHTARLTVDDEDVVALIRNPADHTGRQSIAVADLSAPRVICGRIALSDTRIAVEHSTGISVDGRTADEGIKLGLKSEGGSMTLRGPLPSLCNNHYVAIEFSKSDPEINIGVEFSLENGRDLGWREEGLPGSRPILRIPAWRATTRRMLVMPLWRISGASRHRDGYVSGCIKQVELIVAGPPGEVLTLHRLYLLRDDERPWSHDGCMIGGRLPRAEVRGLRITVGKRAWDYITTSSGYYFAGSKVPRGALVSISADLADGRMEYPAAGQYHEILTDHCDIDFA
jgi:hypothetical protein